MNKTQIEIIGFVFGLFFSYDLWSIFSRYVAPVILREASENVYPSIIVLIALGTLISTLATIFAFYDICKKIDYTYKKYPGVFDKYMIKNVVTLLISAIVLGYFNSIIR